MKVIVFTGPTLPAAEVRDVIDADVRPPAAQGDVYRAALEKPAVMAIIDGYFERVPSVSHKEILWAMKEGIHVFGAASMGALRAAELEAFGMVGVGKIFDAFARGEFEEDDEVAVAHASAEHEYRPLSVAMVDIRATLARAKERGVITEGTEKALVEIAKASFYTDRCYPLLLTKAVKMLLQPQEVIGLHDALPDVRVDQKRADALALLHLIRDKNAKGLSPKAVTYHFQHTDAWEFIARKAHDDAGTVVR